MGLYKCDRKYPMLFSFTGNGLWRPGPFRLAISFSTSPWHRKMGLASFASSTIKFDERSVGCSFQLTVCTRCYPHNYLGDDNWTEDFYSKWKFLCFLLKMKISVLCHWIFCLHEQENFNAMEGFQRRFMSTTCTMILHLPVSYESYATFCDEFVSILNNRSMYVC